MVTPLVLAARRSRRRNGKPKGFPRGYQSSVPHGTVSTKEASRRADLADRLQEQGRRRSRNSSQKRMTAARIANSPCPRAWRGVGWEAREAPANRAPVGEDDRGRERRGI